MGIVELMTEMLNDAKELDAMADSLFADLKREDSFVSKLGAVHPTVFMSMVTTLMESYADMRGIDMLDMLDMMRRAVKSVREESASMH